MFKCIILEGPDGSGKTTLAHRWGDQLHSPVIHTGGPPLDAAEMDLRIMDLALHKSEVIYDRHPAISEQVYGPIHHENSYFTYSESVEILKSYNPLIVYCRPPYDVLRHNLNQDKYDARDHKNAEQWDLVVDNHREIISRYDQWMGEFAECLDLIVVTIDPFQLPR